jgi:hypothetical protein
MSVAPALLRENPRLDLIFPNFSFAIYAYFL